MVFCTYHLTDISPVSRFYIPKWALQGWEIIWYRDSILAGYTKQGNTYRFKSDIVKELLITETDSKRWVTTERLERECHKLENSSYWVGTAIFLFHRWPPVKVSREQDMDSCTNNTCADWSLFELAGTIACELPKTTKALYTSKPKLSKCCTAYYSNTTATWRILLLSGDVELNPGWESGLTVLDSTHVSNSERLNSSTTSINSHIPVRISERRGHLHLYQHSSYNATNCIHINNTVHRANAIPVRVSSQRYQRAYNRRVKPLNLISVSCAPLTPTTAQVNEYIVDNKIDIMTLTETWLSSDDVNGPVIAEATPRG